MSASAASSAPIFEVDRLSVAFATPGGEVRAVDGLSYALRPGEVLAIAGESGSGKSVSCLAAMGLLEGDRRVRVGGAVRYRGEDLLAAKAGRMRALRGDRIAMIFQDPMTALNPYMTIGRQIEEVLESHRGASRRAARARAVEMLGACGIQEPERAATAYPHQYSGGMRQRALIAMALVCEPEIVFADEPTTALDVTTQAQILELLRALLRRLGSALVFVTHDLALVSGFADHVLVMYAGRMVEHASAERLFTQPRHPYTRGLLAAIPRLDGARGVALRTIPGRPPSLSSMPQGCAFAPRCDIALPACAEAVPDAVLVEPDHRAACPVAAGEEATP
jgi:oligopeptide/dipeptide ABC transporter ATP-binding protein